MTPKRILLIDDSRELLDVTKIALEVQVTDWDVLTAESGQDGIAQTISEQPDAILLDVMMPNMDGFAVLEKLKANARTQGIPVIFFTTKAEIEDPERFREAEVQGLIRKPADFLSLAHQISMILGWPI